LSERKHSGGKPKKKCFTFKSGELKLHEDIVTAGDYLGVSAGPGAYIRKMLQEEGVYRPRAGGVCWPFEGEPPLEAKDALRAWRSANP